MKRTKYTKIEYAFQEPGSDKISYGIKIHPYFEKDDIKFKKIEKGDTIYKTNPYIEAWCSEEVTFMWVLNGLHNKWMFKCPESVRSNIFNKVKDGPCDEALLMGFVYLGDFGSEVRSNLSGKEISILCKSIGKTCSPGVYRAANLYKDILQTSDPSIGNTEYEKNRIPYDILIRLGLLKSDSFRIRGKNSVFLRLPSIKNAEESIKESFIELRRRFSYESNCDEMMDEIQGDVLCDEQLKAVENSMNNPVSYITGSAGRGKSSAIIEVIRKSKSTIVCTPTHAARKVIQRRICKSNVQDLCSAEVIAYAKIHAAKYSYGKRSYDKEADEREKELFKFACKCEFKCQCSNLDTLIIDESSMIGIFSLSSLLEVFIHGFPSLCRVVFVGDTKQLRSIGKGNILSDIIESESIPGNELTINHRAGSLSMNVDAIMNGDVSGIVQDDRFQVVHVEQVEIVKKKYENYVSYKRYISEAIVKQLVDKRKQMGYQCHSVCYTNEEVDKVNSSVNKDLLQRGSKVLVKGPNYVSGERKLYKNDILTILSYETNDEMTKICCREWNRTRNSSEDEFYINVKSQNVDLAFKPGFSTTCHSFQGDESDCIVIHAVQNCKYFDRLALYTAASRARDSIVLVTANDDWEDIVNTLNPERVSCFRYVLDESLSDIYEF